jgi:hypothetical protein
LHNHPSTHYHADAPQDQPIPVLLDNEPKLAYCPILQPLLSHRLPPPLYYDYSLSLMLPYHEPGTRYEAPPPAQSTEQGNPAKKRSPHITSPTQSLSKPNVINLAHQSPKDFLYSLIHVPSPPYRTSPHPIQPSPSHRFPSPRGTQRHSPSAQ